jgi:hypothetical protein
MRYLCAKCGLASQRIFGQQERIPRASRHVGANLDAQGRLSEAETTASAWT